MGSSKTAFDAIEQEEEKSIANKLKSKAIKEAKMLLKLEGKSSKIVRKVEVKVKPQSDATGYTSAYTRKPVVSSNSFDKIKQQQKQLQKEYEEKQVINAVMESFQSVRVTDENGSENESENEKIQKVKKVKIIKNVINPIESIARTSDGVSTEKPIYVKLKRRDDNYDDNYDDEDEGVNKDAKEKERKEKRKFDSLEDLDNRMDELYEELDSRISEEEKEEKKVQVPSRGVEVKIPVALYNDGSDSKNPIRWRNGRLVNDKDRFFESMKKDSEVEESDELNSDIDIGLGLEMNSDEERNNDIEKDSDNNYHNSKLQNNIIKTSSINKNKNKKVIVELTGVTMKNMLEHLEISIGFDGLFEETNLRCFSVKPNINSSLKVLRQEPLEWARKKIEYLYIQSKKKL